MTYSGANQARSARESLGKALAALQEDPNIPPDVMAVAQNIAQAVSALFEAERASSDLDGKACVRNALGSLSQTLALLQDVRGEHKGIGVATQVIAQSMSSLYPLTTVPSRAPGPGLAPPPQQAIPRAAPAPAFGQTAPQPPAFGQPAPQAPVFGQSAPQPPPAFGQPAPQAPAFGQPAPQAPAGQQAPYRAQQGRTSVEANIGATTESNFYVGFSGEVSEGGVFLSTYEVLAKGTAVDLLVTLPGGFELRAGGTVRFVRDPLDFSADSEPGMGIQFDQLSPQDRELILRFIRKRPPVFYDE